MGTMRTTLDSTFGGGRNEFLEILRTWSIFAKSWVLAESLRKSIKWLNLGESVH